MKIVSSLKISAHGHVAANDDVGRDDGDFRIVTASPRHPAHRFLTHEALEEIANAAANNPWSSGDPLTVRASSPDVTSRTR